MNDLEHLAKLLQQRNQVDLEIARLIQRPSQQGHIGEYIAAKIFGIELAPTATHKGSDGHFISRPLAGKSVNIKFYGKQESILDINPNALPDFFLVMTGPISAPSSSKGMTRPIVINHIYLFDGRLVADAARRRGVKIGIATSVPQELWRQAEIYPTQTNRALVLTSQQRGMLAMFSSM